MKDASSFSWLRRARKRAQHRDSTVWMRWLALACALLFTVANTAQAAHIHRISTEPGGHHLRAAELGTPPADSPEHCPFCVAAHPALPTAAPVVLGPVLQDEVLPREVAEHRDASAWHFARFSRPPPVRS